MNMFSYETVENCSDAVVMKIQTFIPLLLLPCVPERKTIIP